MKTILTMIQVGEHTLDLCLYFQQKKDVESPSIHKVTERIINYWHKRGEKSIHPLLKARYLGLVYDFSERITGYKPNISVKESYVTSLLEIAIRDLHQYETDTIKKLERAFQVATSINNPSLVEKCKKTILEYEDKVAIDDKPGLWGFAFDNLIENRKINLTEQEERNIIKDLEDRLQRTSDNIDKNLIDSWASEASGIRLGKYYKKKGLNEEIKRVIFQVAKAYLNDLDKSSGLRIIHSLEHLRKIYLQFQLNQEAKELLILIRQHGSKVQDDLSLISYTFDLTKEQTDELDKFFNYLISGDLVLDVLPKIASYYTPKRDEVEKQVLELAKNHPLIFMITKTIFDDKGRAVATIGDINEDLTGRVINQISDNMSLSSIFLNNALSKLIELEQFNEDFFVEEYLLKTPIFDTTRTYLLKLGITSYVNKDYVIAIHLLVPQIEEALRNLLELCGGLVLKPSKSSGGFQLKTFDEILRDKIIEDVLGEDFALYCRVLMTEQRGWNLRNNLCHGMLNDNSFTESVADRVFHIVLCLGLVKEK